MHTPFTSPLGACLTNWIQYPQILCFSFRVDMFCCFLLIKRDSFLNNFFYNFPLSLSFSFSSSSIFYHLNTCASLKIDNDMKRKSSVVYTLALIIIVSPYMTLLNSLAVTYNLSFGNKHLQNCSVCFKQLVLINCTQTWSF